MNPFGLSDRTGTVDNEPLPSDRPLGLLVALATPFTAQEELDLPAFRRLVRHVRRGGAEGLVALGSTGEASTLDETERDRVIATCLEEAGDLPVWVGTGSNSTRQAARWTRRAADLGAGGALVVTPYYNKPNVRGLVDHFERVAEGAPELPLMLYNVPGRTGTNMGVEVLERLWSIPSAVALKESSGDIDQLDALVRGLPPGKVLLAGDDGLALPAIALGARGLVSVAGNLLPAEMRALVDAARAGELLHARRLHRRLAPLFEALFVESNPVPLKAALAELDLADAAVRAPLGLASAATRETLERTLRSFREVAA